MKRLLLPLMPSQPGQAPTHRFAMMFWKLPANHGKEELGKLLAREEGKTIAEATGKPSGPLRYSNSLLVKPSAIQVMLSPQCGLASM